jgi:hypothetical protein
MPYWVTLQPSMGGFRGTTRYLLWLFLCGAAFGVECSRGPATVVSSTTRWRLEPSLKYDALCLLNALSGDPYYLHYYQREYDHFHPLLLPKEQTAFAELKHILKDTGGGIVSATLTLYYSAVDDETLTDMIRTAHDGSAMKRALQATPYWYPNAWRTYEQAAPALETALRALDRVGFATYWTQTVKPTIDAHITTLAPGLSRYDIVPPIEQILGGNLPSHTITIYVLAYSEPHDIRLTGLRFITNISYPFDVALHSAIHEAMHPPYRLDDPNVRSAVMRLSTEPVIVDKVMHHDRSAGYNTPMGLIEEDSVEALEQVVSEQFGVGRNARWYWYTQDGGMHVLAPAIYVGYKDSLARHPEPYSQWLIKAVADGQLEGSRLRSTIRKFFFFLRGA